MGRCSLEGQNFKLQDTSFISRKPSQHPSWIEIDLPQLRRNISIVRSFIGNKLYCLPVKANAYGHGLLEVALEAQRAKVDYLAVAHLKEAAKLREAGIVIPILVLGAIHEDQIESLIRWNVEFTISSRYKAELTEKICAQKGIKARVHLEVDTGMQRTGVRAATAPDLFQFLKASPHFDLVGIYSHMVFSDTPDHEFSSEQIKIFNKLLQNPLLKEARLVRHMANSGAILNYPSAHFDMVRPSFLTLGYAPKSQNIDGLAPCFSLKAKVSYCKTVEAGSGISYGHTFRTHKQTKIITIPVGYGDGYRRALSNQGYVLIKGRRYPIVGTICMDQFMVDVGSDQVHVGEEVVLIGKQGDQEISLQELATLCKTIPYEMLCQFNDRIPRIYKDEPTL